ncbi:alpha/beta hydrolase family protein [Pseudomonas cichorii]|uniref:alpha/beta hydrolase family protein n=1 Tax=Pseudomonas cichorii TaxID=36746 RepID=UPI001C89742D|nr:alpha/beta hydrolase family protein [Pseudomonas cichorii]MBX8514536.1 alpha/beta hydrolase family protein [Pseudomonas cichorii]
MSHTFRATLPALLLSLIVPCALPVVAADPAPAKDAASAEAPVERAPLLTRAQEDAIALERQLPPQDLQQLQAGDESFLALWKPANSADPKGAVILLPGAGESADWPDIVGPLRRKFPDTGWATLSITLPDVQDEALMPREPDAPAAEEKPKDAPKDDVVKAADTQAQAGDEVAKAAEAEERAKAEAEHIFARIESAISFAQQNKARSIVLIGHSSGAYWAARFLNERQSPLVQKFAMVAAREPVNTKPSLLELVPTLKMKTADFIYKSQSPQAASARLQVSKRAKGAGFTQVALINIVGNEEAEQEQIFRRIRGWVEAE